MKPTFYRTAVEQRLGIRFRRPGLLAQALTIGAAPTTACTRTLPGHRQLEYLGDKVLALLLPVIVLQRDPHAPPVKLARQQRLGSNRHLARVARHLGLDRFVLFADETTRAKPGTGHQRKNGDQLANVIEAVLGAIYLDRGLGTAERFVRAIAETAVDDTAVAGAEPVGSQAITKHFVRQPQDQRFSSPLDSPRAVFNEVTRTLRGTRRMPKFHLVQEGDQQGSQNFVYAIWVGSYGDTKSGRCIGHGNGSTKELAMNEAAREALRVEYGVVVPPLLRVMRKSA